LQVSLLGTTTAQTVQLFATDQPSGVSATINPSTGLPPFTATLTLVSSSSTIAGTYNIVITGTGGGQTKQATVSLTVNAPERDFAITVTPNTLTLPQASSGSASVSVQSVGAFSDPVNLATSNLPGGITASFAQNPVTVSPGGTALTTMSLTVSRSVGPGTYSFTVTGTSGTLVKQSAVTVVVTGCLIATATFESELSPEVQFLRDFRDSQILQTFAGSNFMTAFNAWYYSFSPTVANYISTHETARTGMKYALYPLMGILHASSTTFSALSIAPELAAIVAGMVASSLIGIVYLALPLTGILWVFRRRLSRTAMRTAAKWLSGTLAMLVVAFALSEFVAMAPIAMLLSVGIMLTALTTGGLLPALTIVRFGKRGR
jgi:hypothetical protein